MCETSQSVKMSTSLYKQKNYIEKTLLKYYIRVEKMLKAKRNLYTCIFDNPQIFLGIYVKQDIRVKGLLNLKKLCNKYCLI